MKIIYFLHLRQLAVAALLVLAIFTISSMTPVRADSPMWEPVQPYDQYQDDYGLNNLEGIDKRMMSSLLGAAIGGLIGSNIGDGKGQMAATAAGTLIGYMLAGKFMDYMDNSDRQQTYETLESVKNNQTVAWQNPNTMADYQVTPVNTYKDQGQYCREYVTRATIEHRSAEITGTACRQTNGSWQIRN